MCKVTVLYIYLGKTCRMATDTGALRYIGKSKELISSVKAKIVYRRLMINEPEAIVTLTKRNVNK